MEEERKYDGAATESEDMPQEPVYTSPEFTKAYAERAGGAFSAAGLGNRRQPGG